MKRVSKTDPMSTAKHEEVVVALRQLAGMRVMPAKPSALHLQLMEVCSVVAKGKTVERTVRSVSASKRNGKKVEQAA